MTLRRITASLIILLVSAAHAAAQLPPPPPPPPPMLPAAQARDIPFRAPTGTGLLSGRVVTDEQTPQPVRRATVTLKTDAYRTGWTRVTDDRGAFAFTGLPAGRYTLSAAKPGFVTLTYGASRPGRQGTPIAVADGATVTDIALKILRGAAITGVVRDPSGAPLESLGVTVGLITTKNGVRTMAPLGAGASLSRTDDRGEYRVFGLAPGEYAVAIDGRLNAAGGAGIRAITAAEIDAELRAPAAGASAQTAPAETPRPSASTREISMGITYYPSTARIDDAQGVRVAAGEERQGVDVTIEYVPTTTVQGRILDSTGKPAANISLTMVSLGSGRQVTVRASPTDGTFAFGGIASGRYALIGRASAIAELGAAASSFARTMVDVSGTPIEGLNLTLKAGAALSGTLAFNALSGTTQTGIGRVSLTPIVAPGDIGTPVPQATVGADGSFSFPSVAPGRYRIAASSTVPLWAVKSIVAGGRDAIDDALEIGDSDMTGIEIKLDDRVGQIWGTLQGEAGRPAPEFFIIAFPTDEKFWFQNSRRIKTTRPGSDGTFFIRDLPAGDYRIAAVTDVETGEWFEPSFLQQLVAASATLTLTDGERKLFPLKIGGG